MVVCSLVWKVHEAVSFEALKIAGHTEAERQNVEHIEFGVGMTQDLVTDLIFFFSFFK